MNTTLVLSMIVPDVLRVAVDVWNWIRARRRR
jgi:hypothetical protein